jgi:hypothetical protein
MALTNRKLIEGAYRAAGLNAAVFDLTAEDFQGAIEDMQDMLAAWSKRGVRIAYAGGGVEDESGLPDYAQEAVKLNLGAKLAGQMGKQVAPQFLGDARRAMNDLMAATAQIPSVKLDTYYLPSGAGNWSGQVTIAPENDTIDTGKDGPLYLG